MFQFPGFASPDITVMTVLPTAGLSHSEITGSRDICSSPALIAAYHVLHRLCEPRHPPSALSCFISPMNSRTEICPKDTQRTENIAHTFSCIAILISSPSGKGRTSSSISTVLPVSTCQRSMRESHGCAVPGLAAPIRRRVADRIGCAYPFPRCGE